MTSTATIPDSDSEDEYWGDAALDRAFEEVLRISDSQDIPTPVKPPPVASSEPCRTFTGPSDNDNQRVPETPRESRSNSTATTTSIPSVRLYPKLDMRESILADMRRPLPKLGTMNVQSQDSGSSPTYSPGSKTTASDHEEEYLFDSDYDEDEDYSFPLSYSTEGSPGTSPTRTQTDRTSSSQSAPWSQPEPSSSQCYASTAQTPVTPTSPNFLEGHKAGKKPLDRAETMPNVSTSFDSPPSPISRSKSMNDVDEPRAPPVVPSFDLSPDPDGIVCIAHERSVQAKMDRLRVSWGAQYEIARGVCNGWWTWEEVTDVFLERLKEANNQQSAPLVYRELMRIRGNVARGSEADYRLWMELDREQKAIEEHEDRGLGLYEDGTWQGEKNWYGGRIQQIFRLVETSRDRWTLKMDAMRMGRSYRFARFQGSRRLLIFKYDADSKMNSKMKELKTWLQQRFVLCGRVFVPFAVKEGKVYMCEVNDDFQRRMRPEEGDHQRLSLQELVKWHNPLELNKGQEVSKYTSRFDLGLSTSVPVLQFLPENIAIIPDKYADGYNQKSGKKAPAHTIFTDGCGFMNGAALMAIGQRMSYSCRPTAVQGRFLGSKGVWLLHPEDQLPTAPPRIWVRPSQLKIHHVEGDKWTPANLESVHRAQLIFDLLAPARLILPSRLNRLAVLNLAHNGIPKEILVKLMDEGLRAEIDALCQWEGEGAMELLWYAVNRASAVTAQRLQRVSTGLQRALGLLGREADDSFAERDLSDDDGRTSTSLGGGDVGSPDTVAESVLEQLQAGFSPTTDLRLCENVKQVIKNVLQSAIQDFHITVPCSAEAFIVPGKDVFLQCTALMRTDDIGADPFGVLAPGEIHFKSSQYLKDPLKHLNPNTLTGDVLIYRNPARLPSDIQKVHAVDCPELADYVDVIVLPCKGERTLASLLAGGDVDGDTAVCIFDEEIVTAFHGPALTPEPPNLIEECFQPADTILTVQDVIDAVESSPSTVLVARTLQRHLLQGLGESRVGLYSMFHENSIYELGYDNPISIRIGCMFNIVLDSRKTGLRVREEVFRKDKQRHGGERPPCLGGSVNTQGNRVRVRRKVPDPFILDDLISAGEKINTEILAKYDARIKPLQTSSARDKDLQRPFEAATALGPALRTEVIAVSQLVDECYSKWLALNKTRSDNKEGDKGRKGRQQSKESTKALVEELRKAYAEVPSGVHALAALGCLERIKASCAYKKSLKFAWEVAHAELCRIKADAGQSRPFTKGFADVMAVPNAAVRVFAQHTGTILPRNRD
ncbi:hypothetical protein NM688_g1122 [Phlebia brevispora]|uniref:Uncharacterized protein n=1 Tax=Phlebia brevispora TaxID=194682 RepID=A0ACC1TC65_9APHY|nr:hypothetical protein NM688_g1122 [Phlebia brevispora]